MLKIKKALKRTIALGLIAVVGLPANAYAQKLPFAEELSVSDAQMVAYGEMLGKEYFIAQSYTTMTYKENGEETVGTFYSTSEGKINGDWQSEYSKPLGNGQFFNMPPEHYQYIDNLDYYSVYAYNKDGEMTFEKNDQPSKFFINNLLVTELYIKSAVWNEKGGNGSCDASGHDNRFKPHSCYIYNYTMSTPNSTKIIEIYLDKKTALMVHVNSYEETTFDYGNGHVVTQTISSKYDYEYLDKLEKPELFKNYYEDKNVDLKPVRQNSPTGEDEIKEVVKDAKNTVNVSFKVKGHKIKNNKLTLKKGEKVKVKVLNANGQKITFKANGKAIKVNKKGKITAKKKGNAKLIIKVGKKKYTLKIKVTK